MLQPSAMVLAHHVLVPLCPSPILALCTRPILSVPLRTSPIVYQAHFVPGPLCHRPTVSQAHCVPGPGQEDLLFETAVSRSHVKQFVYLCVITVNIHIRTKWVTVILKVL